MVFFRYFYIQHTGYIVTNEIELYDVNNNNVALNKTATSSSVWSSSVPSSAIDGNNTNYFHSQGTTNEWIEIDLGQEFDIRNIRIYNEYGSSENPSTQHNISGASLIGTNDKTGRTDATKRLWSTTFPSISVGSNITSPRYWGFSVPAPPSQVSPTISFSIPAKTFGTDVSFNLVPSSNSTGSFSYTSSNTSVVTVSGSTVTILGAGSSTITATQAETTDYSQGTSSTTLTVSQASPTISFSIPAKTFGTDVSFNLAPSSNSNGGFTFTSSNTAVATISGSRVTILGAGSSTITATQSSTINYLQGTATTSLTVNQASPTISFNDIVKTVGAQPFNLAPISNSNGSFSYTSSNTSVATISTSTTSSVNGTPTFSNLNDNYLSIDIPNSPTMALAISPDGNTMVIPNHYNSNLYFTKYNGTSWSAFVTVNYTSIGYARDCCLTADGLRLIVINGFNASWVGLGRCYFFTWNGTTFDSATQTLDTTSRNYLGVDVTADGSRIVATANGTVYFATWNGTNYTAFTATSETINGHYGIGITRDGSKIAYSNGDDRIYYASWNGTTYTGNTQISGSVSTGRKVRFSYDGNIIFNSLYGNSTGSIQYSLWNGSAFSSFAMVPTSAMPASLDLWGLAVDANNLIYATTYGSRKVYKTSITNTIYSTESKLSIVGAGTSTITANQSASTNYSSGTATATLTVNKIVTVLNGVTNMVKSFGDVFSLNYVSNSNGALSYVISDPSIASIFGSTVTTTKVGSTTITVTQAETENYLQETLSFVLTVNKAEPMLSNFIGVTKTFGDSSFNIVAPTSLSSGAFTYLSSNNSVATVSGSTITIVGAGTSTIIATQETTDEYLSGSITCLLTVNKASPLLSNFNNIVKTYGDPSFNIVAPTSLSPGAFIYASSNTSNAIISEDVITIVGTGSVAIIVTQEETNNYLSESTYCTLTINKIDTHLSVFGDIVKTYGDEDFDLLEPQSDRLGTYTYVSSDESVATIVNNTVTIHSGGLITITAIQDETEIYKPGSITCSLKIHRINSTLNYIDVLLIDGSYKIKVDTNSTGLFTYSVSDSRIVTINQDNTLSFTSPATVTIIATQAESASYYSGEFSTVVSYTGA